MIMMIRSILKISKKIYQNSQNQFKTNLEQINYITFSFFFILSFYTTFFLIKKETFLDISVLTKTFLLLVATILTPLILENFNILKKSSKRDLVFFLISLFQIILIQNIYYYLIIIFLGFYKIKLNIVDRNNYLLFSIFSIILGFFLAKFSSTGSVLDWHYFEKFILNEYHHGDPIRDSVLSNFLATLNYPTMGWDYDTVRKYHFFSHLLVGKAGILLDTIPIYSYLFIIKLFFVPLFVLVVFKFFQRFHVQNFLFPILMISILFVLMISKNILSSQLNYIFGVPSYLISIILFFSFFGIFKNPKIFSKKKNIIINCLIIFILCATKVSTGYIWVALSNFFVLLNNSIKIKHKILYVVLFSIFGITFFYIFDPMPLKNEIYLDFFKSFLDQYNGNIRFLFFELSLIIFFISLFITNIFFFRKNLEKKNENLVLILASFSAYLPSLILQKIPSLNYFNELSLWVGIIFLANFLIGYKKEISNSLIVGLTFFLIIGVTYNKANYYIFSNTIEDIAKFSKKKNLDPIKSKYLIIKNEIRNLKKDLPVYIDEESKLYKDLSINKNREFGTYFLRFQALTGMTQIFSVKEMTNSSSNYIYYSDCKNVYYNLFFQFLNNSPNLKNFCTNINENFLQDKGFENFILFNFKKNKILKNLNTNQKNQFICNRIKLDKNTRYYLVNDTVENIQLKKCVN
jgi:hypothetical protein